MTLNQLRYFCAAARCHSITQAAKALYVTQPAVSIAIRDLEKEFQITLFSYTRNRLELTEEGEAFFARASRLLEDSELFHADFSDPARRRATVRLGIPPMMSTLFFPKLLDEFHREHSDIYLELLEYGSVRASELVQDEQLDAALVNMELYNIDKFACTLLADERLLFCVAAEHHLAARSVIRISDLDQEPLILFNRDSVQNQLLSQQFQSLKVQPRIILNSSQILTILQFVRQGKCGCFFFSGMLPLFPDLVGIPLEPAIPMRMGLILKKGRYLPTDTQSFVKFCEKYYGVHA